MAVDATTQLQHYDLIIGGRNVPAASGETFETVSPTTNEPVGRMAQGGRGGRRSRRRRRPPGVRRGTVAAHDAAGAVAHHAQDRDAILRERLPEIAVMETTNCGKIIVESRGDVTASANCFEYYAGLATQLWGEQIPMNGPCSTTPCASRSVSALRSCPGISRC